jgi:nucleoside-diphosphate-sugar epimerase
LKKRVLVTGATGFVGRQIVRNLSRLGCDLVLVIREGKQNTLNDLSITGSVVKTADLFSEDEFWWAKQCHDVDTIVHAAWYAETGKYLQSSKNLKCLSGSLKLAQGAVSAGVRRIIGVGTCFEYDLKDGELSVSTPLKPISTYAATKAALFMTWSQWLPAQSTEFAWCRLFYIYGEGEDVRRLVPYLRSRLEKGETAELTNGKQIRDFLDVAEVGNRIAQVALGNQEGPINICSGTPITVRQLAEQIAEEYGRLDLLKFGVREDNLVDPPCVFGLPNLK